MFGSNLLNDNLESIIKANDICNRYGLDTISTGATIAFAIECYENGLITREDTGGLELGWGDHAAIVQLTEMIGRREGIGDLLAEGSRVAGERIGGGASEYAVHAGGQELAAHDPRFAPTFAVNAVADATPGRHTQMGLAWFEMGAGMKGIDTPDLDKYEVEGKGELNARLLDLMNAVLSMGVCLFVYGSRVQVPMWPQIVQAVTGWDCSLEELERTGARIGAIRQAFNVREGVRVADVYISPRATGHPPLESGPLADVVIDMETRKRDLYRARGWDPQTGRPLEDTLVELDLAHVAGDLYGGGA
jgi:aldehyde:ferredoxin oxidoreductase